mmetsp:Transcript_33123/g.37952  ORF Transcript_33123/g.37952 Transcript_33123/m.37952 type:complete len:919 (+) Transcript_33123:179-2935(+)
MKKQIVPISSSDDQDHTMASSPINGRTSSRIRLRRSSSKNKNSDNGKRQQQQKFSKRPYLYKSGEHSPTKQTRSGIHFNNLISENNNQTPVHWIDWIDSGMELFGCGIATANTDDVPPYANKSSSRLDSTNTNTQSHHQQKGEDIAAIQKRHKQLMERDYIQLHEDFFDSLLKEEGNQMLGSILAAVAAMSLQQTESRDTINGVGSSSYSVTSAISSVSSAVTAETDISGVSRNNNNNDNINNNNIKTPSISSTRTIRNDHCWGNGDQKRRKRTTANIEEYDQLYNPDLASTTTEISKIKSSSFSSSTSRRSSSLNNNNNNTSAQSSNITTEKKSSSSSVLCIKDIMAKEYLEPSGYYVHPQCRLQKDKGKGVRLESCISATGRELCLEKLRDKMKLIIEVSGELQAMSFNTVVTSSSSKSNNNKKSIGSTNNDITSNYKAMSAGMKRRRAKIALIEKNNDCSEGRDDGSCIIETRSMIELQLGFLSMQYGLLLRWDAYRTGQIVYVCLRKMCHDSFYTKIPSAPVITTTTNSHLSRQCMEREQPPQNERSLTVSSSRGLDNDSNGPPRIIAATKKREVTSPLVVRSRKGGNHAIYQRASGATEIVLVDAPYHVPQPEVFAPSVLTLDIHQLTGLDPKSRWTLSMTFDGHTEIAHLIYNQQERVFETTRTTPCKWEMIMLPHKPVTSFDVATGLEIRLFEQRPKQRLRGVVSVGGIVKRSSSTSSFVPAGRDPFSLTSPSKSYVIENQRLIHYNANNNGKLCSSESSISSSIGSSNSFIGSISSRNSLKKSTSRLASTMTVPLGGLVSQPSTSQTALWKLTIPFTHNEDAHVNLTLMHQSDYAHWLYRELRARRKEELVLTSAAFPLVGESGSGSDLWHRLISSRNSNNEDDSEEEEDSDDNDLYFLDWLIYCCFDPK